ncbi:MAG: EI24 domain-containing protein [Polyangia bacterium]
MSGDSGEERRSDALARPVRAAKGTALGFAAGFRHLLGGLRFAYVDHRELAKLYVPPMLLGALILVGGWIGFAYLADDVVAWLWAEPEQDAWWGIKHCLWSALVVVVWVAFFFVTVVSSAAAFVVMVAPFNDFISEQTEGIIGSWEPRPLSIRFLLADLGHTVAFELARLGLKAAWLIPLLILSWIIPVIGHLVYIGFGGYLLAKYFGMDYVDWTLARRGYSWKERLAFARRHRWALAGFGTAVILALMIPLGFVLVWPGAVTGGTRLAISLGPEDRRDRRAGEATRDD